MLHNPEFMAYAQEAHNRGLTETNLTQTAVIFVFPIPTRRRMLETLPAPADFDIDCTPPEVLLYEYFLSLLLEWATYGYPPERLARDLRWLAAR